MSSPTRGRSPELPSRMNSKTDGRIVVNRMEGVLVATIQVTMTSATIRQLREDVLNFLAGESSPSLLLDLSGISLMDLEEFDSLRRLAHSVALMGTATWFVGLRPEVVATLVTLGAETGGLRTALDLDAALHSIRREREGVTNG